MPPDRLLEARKIYAEVAEASRSLGESAAEVKEAIAAPGQAGAAAARHTGRRARAGATHGGRGRIGSRRAQVGAETPDLIAARRDKELFVGNTSCSKDRASTQTDPATLRVSFRPFPQPTPVPALVPPHREDSELQTLLRPLSTPRNAAGEKCGLESTGGGQPRNSRVREPATKYEVTGGSPDAGSWSCKRR